MADGREHGRDAQQQARQPAGIQPGQQAAPKTETKPVSSADLPVKLSTLPSLLALRGRRKSFALGILSGLSGSEAARQAGYSATSAKHAAYRLQCEEDVKQAIEEGRAALAESTGYDLQQAMIEADEALKLARDSGNAMAFTKTVEFRAKLHGLLVDRHEVTLDLPDVTGAIGRANARLVRDVDEAEDAELVNDERPALEHQSAEQAEPIADFRNLSSLLS